MARGQQRSAHWQCASQDAACGQLAAAAAAAAAAATTGPLAKVANFQVRLLLSLSHNTACYILYIISPDEQRNPIISEYPKA